MKGKKEEQRKAEREGRMGGERDGWRKREGGEGWRGE